MKTCMESEDFNDLIVDRIEQLCEDKSISYYKLAKDSGMSKTCLLNYLNRNHVSTTITMIKKICNALEISVYDFYNHESFM